METSIATPVNSLASTTKSDGLDILSKTKDFDEAQEALKELLEKGKINLEELNEKIKDSIAKDIASEFLISETGKEYTDEEVEAAQDKFASLSKEEQEDMKKAYENGMKEMMGAEDTKFGAASLASTCAILKQNPDVDKFLEEHPEYKEAFETMGPIVQDYNDYITDVVSEYYHDASPIERVKLLCSKSVVEKVIIQATSDYTAEYMEEKFKTEEE